MLRYTGGCSLTGAELGGITWPEAVTVQPDGTPGMEVCTEVASVELATQGQTLGVSNVDDESRWVPPKGEGAPLETSVTDGADAAAEEAALLPLPLMVPPLLLMLCQLPVVSEYVYCVPVL